MNETHTTAAAAIESADELSHTLRSVLPALLETSEAGDPAAIAEKLHPSSLFTPSTIASLRELLEDCQTAIRQDTTQRTEWIVTGYFNDIEEFGTMEIDHPGPRATQLSPIALEITNLVRLLRRTNALLVATKVVSQHQ